MLGGIAPWDFNCGGGGSVLDVLVFHLLETLILGPSHLFLNAWLAHGLSLMGLVYAPMVVIIFYTAVASCGVAVYLVLTRRFSAEALGRGSVVSFSAAAGEVFAWMLFTRMLRFSVAAKLIEYVWSWCSWQLLFIVLLFSIWAARERNCSFTNLKLELLT